MRLTRKTIVLAIALLAIITTSVFGTIAYLTDTAEVTNTFTIGKVDIDVFETVVDENGTPVQKTDENGDPVVDEEGNPVYERTTDDQEGGEHNNYKMIPGKSYTKDPTLAVIAGSEPAYYRMMVTFTNLEGLRTVFDYEEGEEETNYFTAFVPEWNVDEWTYEGAHEGDDTMSYEFRYKAPADVDVVNGQELGALFETLKVPGEFTSADLEALQGMEIKIYGHAIQMAGFDELQDVDPEDAAWAEFDGQLQDEDNGGEGSDPEPDVDQGASED